MTIIQKIYMKLPKANCEAKSNYCKFLKKISINHIRGHLKFF